MQWDASERTLSLFLEGEGPGLEQIRNGSQDHARLLVPSWIAQTCLAQGINVSSRSHGGPVATFVPMPDENKGWQRVLAQRGWTLLVQRPRERGHSSRPHAVIENTCNRAELTGGTTVWLNPLVVAFHADTPVPGTGEVPAGQTPVDKAIRDALHGEHALWAAMADQTERRAIGWRAIWSGSTRTALAALFQRDEDADPLHRPSADLATLDAMRGSFVAERDESGVVRWKWAPPTEGMSRTSEALVRHLAPGLGIEMCRRDRLPGRRFEWGIRTGRRRGARGTIRTTGETRVHEALRELAQEVQRIDAGRVLARILHRFAAEAAKLQENHARAVFGELVRAPARWSGERRVETGVLLDQVQNEFFKPLSAVLVPLRDTIREPGVTPQSCCGPTDFNRALDPFRSPADGRGLLMDIFLEEGRDARRRAAAGEADHRDAWYDLLCRHFTRSTKPDRFKLVRKDVFVLDHSKLDEGLLA